MNLCSKKSQMEIVVKGRKKANNLICDMVKECCNKYPELRFHQVLWLLKIFEKEHLNGVIKDKFNEESHKTLKEIQHTIVNKYVDK